MKNIKKISKKLLEASTEVWINLQDIVNITEKLGNSQEEKLVLWFKNMMKFVKNFKNHLKEGIEILGKDLQLEEFSYKKVEMKKRSEIVEATEALKKFLAGTKKEKKKKNQREDDIKVKIYEKNFLFLGNN